MRALSLSRSHGVVVFVGVALLFVSAQIRIPIQPVPVTLQTLAVMLIGLVFERRAAVHSILAYGLLGLAGLPVFAGFASFAILGPTLGYLIGFLPAVWVMCTLREKLGEPNSWFELLRLSLLGSMIVYGCGVVWLSLGLGLQAALWVGFVPFIMPGLIKALLLSGVIRFLRH